VRKDLVYEENIGVERSSDVQNVVPDCPSPPPPSPVSSDYVSNVRYLESLDFYHEEYFDDGTFLMTPCDYADEQLWEHNEGSVDLDYTRRMSYVKKSVTEGEVLILIKEYNIWYRISFRGLCWRWRSI
jgi:hypothetical protein